MNIVRIFFTKTGEAAYISHLDLQRVMARALRKSGMPVWYSQGFNPHIYMSFALPLPLMHESLCEVVDCKTEIEAGDFSGYFSAFIKPLSEALPRGIEVTAIAAPVRPAGDIAEAEYTVTWPGRSAAGAADGYNSAKIAMVVRKTKRSETEVDLKQVLPEITLAPGAADAVTLRLPAGSANHYSPALLTGYLQQAAGLPADEAHVLRLKVFAADGAEFT